MLKKNIYIFICFFLFFSFSDLVYATDIIRYNQCSGKTNNSFNESCANKESPDTGEPIPKNDSITKTITVTEEEIDDCGDKVPYNIVLLLDISSSMAGDKVSNAVNGVNSMLQVLEKKKINVDMNVNICKFGHTYFGCSGFVQNNTAYFYKKLKLSNDSYFRKFDGSGASTGYNLVGDDSQATNIQYGLYKAGDYLNGINNDYAPMVILITDGYPTVANSSVINSDIGVKGGTDRLLNMTSARYVYYTLNQLKDLKNILDEKATSVGKSGLARILTFNINSLMADDPLSKFLLNPNDTTKKALNDDATKEAKTLYNMLNGNTVYEAFAGIWSYEDYGVYRGEYNATSKTITFTIPASAYSNVPSTSLDLRVFIPEPSNKDANANVVNKITINGREYCNDKTGKTCTATIDSGFKKYKISNNVITKCLKNGQNCSSGNINIVLYVSSLTESKFSSIPIPKNLKKLVYYSFSGDAKKFSDIFSKAVSDSVCKEVVEIKTEIETIEDDVQKYEYDNCSAKTTTIGNLYYKTDTVYYGSPGGTNSKPAGTCVEATGRLDYIMTEYLNFEIGSLKNNPSIYAGGGFNWNGTKITNDIVVRFQYLYSDNSLIKPVFTQVNLKVYDLLGDKVVKNYVGISEIYTDPGCSSPVTVDFVKSKLLDSAKTHITSSSTSSTISTSFKTVHSDDASDLNDTISFDVAEPSYSFIANNSGTDLNYSTSLSYGLSWPRACLSKDGRTISYKNGDCTSDQIDGGYFRYTPLKFSGSSFMVEIEGNYSSVVDINFNVKASCPVNVMQILYECPSGDCEDNPSNLKISYAYRSIDHTNPFPKNIISANWKAYKEEVGNFDRLTNSYNNYSAKPDYSYSGTFNFSNDDSYTSWSNMESTGSSKFVSVSNGFDVIAGLNLSTKEGNYCPLGIFNSTCNSVVS